MQSQPHSHKQQSLNNSATNTKQPERRLTPRGRSAVVGKKKESGSGKRLLTIILIN